MLSLSFLSVGNYQQLPYKIDPIAFNVGSFSMSWYSLMYVAAFVTVYFLLAWRLKNREANYSKNLIIDFLFYALLGALVGGRLGYVIFYNLPFYLAHPLDIVSPFDETGRLIGIYGMSYHGGLMGVITASLIFAKNNKLNFWRWADFVVPAIPAGYFFGRVGNFLNGELYGRVTNVLWGMYFPSDLLGLLRHPSQLYEAFFEGVFLFVILWLLRNNKKLTALYLLLPAYLFGYGLVRFILEFFREPDPQIGLFFNNFSLGQIFSLVMAISAIIAFAILGKKQYNRD